MKAFALILLFFCFSAPTIIINGEIISNQLPSSPTSFVYDETGSLSKTEKSDLESYIAYNSKVSGDLIYFLIYESISSQDKSLLINHIFYKWNLDRFSKNRFSILIVYFKKENIFLSKTSSNLDNVEKKPDFETEAKHIMLDGVSVNKMYGAIRSVSAYLFLELNLLRNYIDKNNSLSFEEKIKDKLFNDENITSQGIALRLIIGVIISIFLIIKIFRVKP